MGLSDADDLIIVEPGGEADQRILRSLAGRLLGRSPALTPWRRLQVRRWAILNEDVSRLAWERLKDQFTSERSRETLSPHVSDLYNPAADIVERLCRVYRHGIQRTFSGSKAKQKALQQLYREADVRGLAGEWNRLAYFVGPLTAVPVVRDGRMRIETVSAHQRELVLNANDPCGHPLAVAWRSAADRLVVAMQGGLYEYAQSPDGAIVATGTALESRAHDEGGTPFPILRFQPAITCDDWDRARSHERLTAATIDASAVGAVMGQVRQTQNKYLLYVSGYLDGMPKGQSVTAPHLPVMIPTKEGQQVVLDALAFNTPPKDFLDHIRFIYAVAAESTGQPAMIAQEGSQIDLEFAYDGVSELREEQIQSAAAFEMELAVAMVCAAQAGGHPIADQLPSPKEIRDKFRTSFGRMSRRFADPQQQREQADWEVRHGLISIADLLAAKHPEVDRDDLMSQIRRTLAENSELWDMLAAHQIGADSSGKAITAAQQNGAKGPAARDEGKNAQ